MSDIESNITLLKHQLPSTARLVAVSKTQPVSEIVKAYNAGHRIFGENRVQELLSKKDSLPDDIEWHLIGHLQRNKVKYIVPFINMIQSVDKFSLLEAIEYEASKIGRVVDCLLQIHIASEDTKFGFSMKELEDPGDSSALTGLKYVRICGVMGMATFTTDTALVQKEFSFLNECFYHLRSRYFERNGWFREISMGMSGDYEIALKEGSTIVRIGSLIFGERNISH